MEVLYSFNDKILNQTRFNFYRYLYDYINWDRRMLAIKGPRGAGKTTLMLQRLKQLSNRGIYITADHYWFFNHNLVETIEEFYKEGIKYIFIDEVHKYPGWSLELKNIYDGFPDIHIIFSSSSALDVYRGAGDLSRRVITYDLHGMSFREYLNFKGYGNYEKLNFEDILYNHRQISQAITQKFRPLPYFKQYLQSGYFPFVNEISESEFPITLTNMINTVIESDLSYIENYNAGTVHKVKKLLGVIAESAPFKPNISAIARKIDATRDSVYSWIAHLEKAKLINLLLVSNKGTSLLQKPEKIYLENANISYALKNNPDKGAIRETFIYNQLKNSGLNTTMPQQGDFLVNNEFVIEVGGKNKNNTQIKNSKHAFIASDEIESGFSNKIPLWLFGFLY